jgi:hypothetical protein
MTLTAEEVEVRAEDRYEQSIADGAAADGCFESIARWNTPAYKDLPEDEKAVWREGFV